MTRFVFAGILCLCLVVSASCRNSGSAPGAGAADEKQNQSTKHGHSSKPDAGRAPKPDARPTPGSGSDSQHPFDFNAVDFYTYTSEADGFSVDLPVSHRDVEREATRMDTPLGKKASVVITAEAHDLMLMATAVPLPELNALDAAAQHESMKTFARALAAHGELIALGDAKAGDLPAVSVRYTLVTPEYTLHFEALVLYRNAHEYMLQAGALDPALLDTRAVKRFQESFKLME